jgi:predicted membrane-bound spermidine synthase
MPTAIRLASALFFASGAAALTFETLWFRRAGLAFGNSIWASALVLSSFMAGMAVGNAVAARVAPRLRRPFRSFAVLELTIAVTGVLLVFGLPLLGPALAPMFRPLLPSPWLLQPLRFATGFVVLLLPAIAMGATLPILVHALRGQDEDFGHLLGRLYGWNTLGAMAGCISVELLWIPLGGIHGAAATAVGFNALAAAGALWLGQRIGEAQPPSKPLAPEPLPKGALRVLLAAAASGAIALAFEVVWFRVVIQYLPNSSAMFAWMLAVVLGGIACGSLLASHGFQRSSTFERNAAPLACLAAALAVLSHAAIPWLMTPTLEQLEALEVAPGALFLPLEIALTLCLVLMLPVSIASGALFTMLGKRLESQTGVAGRATGLLALSNSAGAALGPLVAGFFLLPRFGVDASTITLAAGYLLVGVLVWDRSSPRVATGLAAASGAIGIAFFPHGLHGDTLIRLVRAEYGSDEAVVAVREGIVETAVVTRVDWQGELLYHRLVTDGYTMAAESLAARRYMRLFAYLPAAFHPHIDSALLISFGVGNTASALTELDSIERIDIVDISPEILSLAGLIHEESGDNPLDDPRVRVHIEDGRYYLQTATETYDLITSEPPPPAFAGVVNLYTQEYFDLIRSRLNQGGFASYWLPVSQMRAVDSQAIVHSFCEVFPDCSLWEADPSDWILMGSRDAKTSVDVPHVEQLWSSPRTGPELRSVGLESPGQLGALFLADAAFLRDWSAAVPALVDAHPERAPAVVSSWTRVPEAFSWIHNAASSAQRFAADTAPGALWPRSLVQATRPHFERANLNRMLLLNPPRPLDRRIAELHATLTRTALEAPALWILDSDTRRAAIASRAYARGDRSRAVLREMGVSALARREYRAAASYLKGSSRDAGSEEALLEAYALVLAGEPATARAVAREANLAGSPLTRGAWLSIVGLIEAEGQAATTGHPSS